MSITEIFNKKCNDNSDICQHLPTLKKYAEGCNVVIELGVRSIVSTWAFLEGKPNRLISVDIHHPSHYKDYDSEGCNIELVEHLSKEQRIDFEFIQGDSRKVKLPDCDLMFFDTLHTYHQLSDELAAHGSNVKKYMIFHDTETYRKELVPAINQFLNKNNDWKVIEKFSNNNGLWVLGKAKIK